VTAPSQRKKRSADTATRVLDAAERLVQTMGFNWFSYADIAEELGIRKASLHHHFPSKADLGRALLVRYSDFFRGALRAIDDGGNEPLAKLERYVKLYDDVLRDRRMCLCGMLAAEYDSLPKEMQAEIRRFFDLNEAWLAGVIEQGRDANVLHTRGTAREVARTFLSGLEGAMLVARPYNDVARFANSAQELLEHLRNPGIAIRRVRSSAR
jgi:TetR/AcrR family transcriptional repressor of nem operon